MNFDTPTLLIVTSILCTGMSLALVLVWRFVLRERALLLWGIAQGCFALGMILMTQRDALPDFITIIVANSFNLACYALIWWAACDYRRVAPPAKTLAAAFAIFLSSYLYYTYVELNIVVRIAVIHLLVPALMAGAAATLIRRRDGHRVGAEVAAGLAFLVDAALRLMVLALVFTNPSAAHPLHSNQVIAITMLSTIVSFIAWGLAVIMMVLDGVTRQLAGSRNLLQSVLDTIPARVFWKDRDSRYLGCNRHFAADAGLASSEAIPGKTDDDLAWRAQAENYRLDDRQVIASGKSKLHYEESITLADGSLAHVSTSKVPLRGTQNDIIGMVGAYEDITERKQAEETLREREMLIRELLGSASEAIYGVTCDGAGLFVNNAGVRMLGYQDAEELIGKNIHALIHHSKPDGSPYPAHQCPLARAFGLVEEIHGDDEVFWRKDGSHFPVEYWSHPMMRDNQVIGAVVTFFDISERKQTAEALRRLNESLAEQVQSGVSKNMAQERLLIQQSRLAAMGEMIGNIAHQWRQPINALTLILANIKDAYEFNDLSKEFLDEEINNGQQLIQRMSSTIDDFRSFFKPNKEKQHFRVGEAVADAIKLVSSSFHNNEIGIDVTLSAEANIAFGYPNEFAQVVLNALSNAKDAITGKNGGSAVATSRSTRKIAGKVSVRIEQGSDAIRVFICDNGGGIPEELLDKVFDPYFTTKEKGTGIGLYMSKMIMDNMGGDIAVHNRGDGAEILVTLPLAKDVQEMS